MRLFIWYLYTISINKSKSYQVPKISLIVYTKTNLQIFGVHPHWKIIRTNGNFKGVQELFNLLQNIRNTYKLKLRFSKSLKSCEKSKSE